MRMREDRRPELRNRMKKRSSSFRQFFEQDIGREVKDTEAEPLSDIDKYVLLYPCGRVSKNLIFLFPLQKSRAAHSL